MGKKKLPHYKKIDPDFKYDSVDVAQFANYLMNGGKKDTALKMVYRAFDIIKEKTDEDPIKVFKEAIENASPLLEVKSKRIGGASYQIPYEVDKERQQVLAMRWIIEGAKELKGEGIGEKIAKEILNAYNDDGYAVRKKEESHRMAEANKAFAHYARF